MTKHKKRFFTTYNIAVMAVLAAMSLVLSEFPKIPWPPLPFLEIDFSDVPIIFSGFLIHPLAVVVISAIKNSVGLFTSSTGMVGELSNFVLSSAYGLTASLLSGKARGHIRTVIFTIAAVLVTTGLALLSNHFIMFPLYFGGTNVSMLFVAILPFNLVKFGLQSTVFLALCFSLRQPLGNLRRKELCKDSNDPFCMFGGEDNSTKNASADIFSSQPIPVSNEIFTQKDKHA